MTKLTDDDRYVLQALTETRDGGGTGEVMHRANRLIQQAGRRRRLTYDKARQILEFLDGEGMVARQNADPVIWMITRKGRDNL